MYTEKEAAEKWCPMSRPMLLPGRDINTLAGRHRIEAGMRAESRCIASACMMWRLDCNRGYCGLAGKPV